MKISPAKPAIRLTICAAALLLSNQWCLAQNCPTTSAVIINTANEETLDSQYQPYPTGTPPVLKRYRFVPPGTWPINKKFPTVLMIPPNVFQNGMIIDEGEPGEKHASYDLQFAGFLVFQVETRLAPPGTLPGQVMGDLGRAPEQTDDLKRQIMAVYNDSQSNGNIYLVGGSSGGCLALWCALDPASTVSGWNETARAHIKAVVSLSGPSDFCDYTGNPGHIPPNALTKFQNDLDNYVGLGDGMDCDPNHDPMGLLNHASPSWLVTNGATSNPPAFMLYATAGDPVPNSQATDMFQALTTHYGINVPLWITSYTYGSTTDHAFKYWPAKNDALGSDGLCVHQEVINFLLAH